MESLVQVDVIFPCLNEELALSWVLSRMPEGYRAIVVDNGSTDRSADIARSFGALVVIEPRKGFGSAAHAGLLAATAPVVAFCDADASFDPLDLPTVVNPVLEGSADAVLGQRIPTSFWAWPLQARLANKVLANRIRKITGYPLHDLGPMRAMNREAMLSLGLTDRRSGYPLEFVLKASKTSWKIVEVEIPYSPRIGKSKVTGTIKGLLTAVKDMSKLLAEVK
jgi:glycosyltransferase involved in cell wall biosynthesis